MMCTKAFFVAAILASVNAVELGLGAYATRGILLTKVLAVPVAHVQPQTIPKAQAAASPIKNEAPVQEAPKEKAPTSYASVINHFTHDTKTISEDKPVTSEITKEAPKEETPTSYDSVINHITRDTKTIAEATPIPIAHVIPVFHVIPISHAIPIAASQDKPMKTNTNYQAVTKTDEVPQVAPETHSAPVSHVEYADAHPQYTFEYGVKDPHTHDIKNQHEERDGDVVKGYYSLHQPDGVIRTVHYNADHHNGFNAQVEYEGHAIHPEVKHETTEDHH